MRAATKDSNGRRSKNTIAILSQLALWREIFNGQKWKTTGTERRQCIATEQHNTTIDLRHSSIDVPSSVQDLSRSGTTSIVAHLSQTIFIFRCHRTKTRWRFLFNDSIRSVRADSYVKHTMAAESIHSHAPLTQQHRQLGSVRVCIRAPECGSFTFGLTFP